LRSRRVSIAIVIGPTPLLRPARASRDPDRRQRVPNRVDDLDALLGDLAAAGVWIDPKRQNESYGRFAWIKDCDGNRVELWQPLDQEA
jgi:predicted enzyme related to lactoylglutathione lyase